MTKLPYRVDEPAAKVDAMLNEHQRRKIEAVDLFRKPHLTWHEYQTCLTLDEDRRQMFLAVKRRGEQVNIFYAVDEFDRKLKPVIVPKSVDLRPGAINNLPFPTHQKPQKQSRLQRLYHLTSI